MPSVWFDGVEHTACDQCRTMYNDRMPPELPPCHTCRVELIEENEDAAKTFMLTRRQFVTADQGQVVDISIPAVKVVMDMFEIENQESCLMRVRNLFHHFENERRRDAG